MKATMRTRSAKLTAKHPAPSTPKEKMIDTNNTKKPIDCPADINAPSSPFIHAPVKLEEDQYQDYTPTSQSVSCNQQSNEPSTAPAANHTLYYPDPIHFPKVYNLSNDDFLLFDNLENDWDIS